MRKGRYVTNDNIEPIDELSDVTWSIDMKNIVTIQWKWARNGGIKLAAVFTADSADDTLEQLLTTQPEPVIITKDINKPYAKPLDAPEQIYKIYPAKFGKGSDIMILNQQQNNATGIVTKILVVNYKIEYKPLPLSDLQRVTISIHCSDKPVADNILTYEKCRNSASVCTYPISGEKDANYECYIKKNEDISICVNDDYAGSVILRKERADGIARK